MQHKSQEFPSKGLLIAMIITILWIGSLGYLLYIDISFWWVLWGILGRTFSQTGLFIVAHDAIHGSVCSGNHKLNDAIGRSVVILYAVLDYEKLAVNHKKHHQQPGQEGDPDFYNCNRFTWYLKFLRGYSSFQQILMQFLGLGTIFIILYFGLHAPIINIFSFWILPIFLSTIQLFFFGTYLPHRFSNAENSYQITSSNYPLFWSFITCYHFGYHCEHHEYPFLAWYDLPSIHQFPENNVE